LTPTVRQFRRRFLSAVACGLLLTTVADRCLAAAAEEYSSLPKLHLEIQHVVHFIGLVDVKPNLSGELRCDSRKISFVAAGASAEIPTRSWRARSSTIPSL
jgi:hypothetical protein